MDFTEMMDRLRQRGHFEGADLRQTLGATATYSRENAYRLADHHACPYRFEIPRESNEVFLMKLAEQDMVMKPWTILSIHHPLDEFDLLGDFEHVAVFAFTDEDDAVYAKMFT